MSNASVLFDVPGPKAARRHRIIGILTIVGVVLTLAAIVWKLAVEDQLTAEKWEPFVTPRLMTFLLEALLATVQAAVAAIAGAIVFGVIFGVAKLSDHAVVRWPAWLVVEFFRAVPLLLLIIFVWTLFGNPTGVLLPLIIGLILYNGSVLAEIFRAGINAVPKGQSEAAFAVGMRKTQVMRIIQLPQAVKMMLPAIISQCIVTLKDTSLGFAIAAPGLTVAGRRLWTEFDNRLATALVLATMYIILCVLLSKLGEWFQRRYVGESKEGGPASVAMPAGGGPA